jgi:NADPH2:quinone reductase
MKAIWMTEFGGPDALHADETAMPVPGDQEVLIEVDAAGVAFGDVMKRMGAFGTDFSLPAGIGQEIAGTVRQSCVGGPAVGSRVAAMVDHGYAEYVVARMNSVVSIPQAVDGRDAALLWVHGVTAYQALCEAGRLRTGDVVLVHAAAGGVGTLALQLAKLLGARTVIGTSGTPEKLDHIRSYGADLAVDCSKLGWEHAVLELTDGHGADVVLDSIGGEISQDTLACTAAFGRIVIYGAASGAEPVYHGMSLMNRNLTVTGYSLQAWHSRPASVSRALEQVLSLLAAGDLRLEVTEYKLDEAADAHRALSDRATVGSIVLRP